MFYSVRWSKWDGFFELLTSKRLKPRILQCAVVQNLVFYEVFEGSACTTLEPFGQKSMERAADGRPNGRPMGVPMGGRWASQWPLSVTPRPPMRAHPPRTPPNLSCCKLETSSLELAGCWWLAGGCSMEQIGRIPRVFDVQEAETTYFTVCGCSKPRVLRGIRRVDLHHSRAVWPKVDGNGGPKAPKRDP